MYLQKKKKINRVHCMYVESTVFYECWPEHSLIRVHTKQKGVSKFFYFNTFIVVASSRTLCANFLIVEPDKCNKR